VQTGVGQPLMPWGGDRAGGKGVCGRLMSPVQETQSMREIRLLRGRLPRKGGGNVIFNDIWLLICLTPLQVNWFMLIN
jgi:hypothetical protein